MAECFVLTPLQNFSYLLIYTYFLFFLIKQAHSREMKDEKQCDVVTKSLFLRRV